MFRPAIALLALFTLLLGGLYPGLVTAFAQTLFPTAANGGLVTRDGQVEGAKLLGQEFTSARYFWGRLSATTPPYNAAASAASNLSPRNPALKAAVQARLAALRAADPGNKAEVPVDLVTASASGLDPHISPQAAEYQLERVARTRGVGEAKLRAVVKKHTEMPLFGLLGEPHVNVLALNMALDDLK